MGSPRASIGGGGGGGGIGGNFPFFLRRGIRPMVCSQAIRGFNVRRMCGYCVLFRKVLARPSL